MANLYLNVVPARIVTSSQTYNKSRLLVIDDQAFIYAQVRGQVVLEKRSTVSDWRASQAKGTPYVVQTEDGLWEAFEQPAGCACSGRALRDFDWHQAMVPA